MPQLRPLAAAVVCSLAVVVLGCGEKKVVCPPNYHAVGTFCYENEVAVADTSGASGFDSSLPGLDSGNATADTGQTDTSKLDSGGADSGSDAATDGNADAISKPDTTKVDVKPGGKNVIGAACGDDLDCVSGLQCFSWPKGYCTVVNCDAPGSNCPGSSVCYAEPKAAKLCHFACDSDPDCRTGDGYACKRLTAEFGGIEARMCSPSGKNPVGLGCSKASECQGSATCLTDMAGGYCARIGCGSADPCDSGAACVLRNGKPTCLKVCTADVECQIGGGNPRKCVDKTDLSKAAVKVCLDSSKSAPVGATCLTDLDCDTKVCSIFAKGTCTTGGQPCLGDEQCGAAGPCKIEAGKEKGVCTAACAPDKKCPVNSVCVPTKDKTAGVCQPACKGPGDDASCGGVPGLQCVYGQPLAIIGINSAAAYACAPIPAGGAGAMCVETKECNNALCLTNNDKSAGFCAPDCGSAKFCTFGSACDDNGMAQCFKMCSGDFDCPAQMACKGLSGLAAKVCLPP